MAVRSGFPILTTDDLERLAGFYEQAFDAERTYSFAGEDGRPVYVALDVGGAHLGLGLGEVATPHGRVAVWFYVADAGEVDETYERALAAGGTSEQSPADMPWGERVAQVRDPDGLVVSIGAATGSAKGEPQA